MSLNLLAFAMHTVCDIGDEFWRNARTKLRPRYSFFSKLAAITTYLIFPVWDDLFLTLAFFQAAAHPAVSAAPAPTPPSVPSQIKQMPMRPTKNQNENC